MGEPLRPRDPEEEVPLLPIAAHLQRILDAVAPLPSVRLPLSEVIGCVAAADVRSPAALPPFASSAMDGYAVRAADIATASEEAPVALRVNGEVRMGAGAGAHVEEGTAVLIPTGGVVPPGCDAVVPVELTDRRGDDILVLRALPAGKHVRPAGEDVAAGDIVIARGRRLRAPDVGVAAACGSPDIEVVPRVRVGVLATGDELVRPGGILGDGQIHDANTFTLMACVEEAGGIPVDGGPVGDAGGALIAALDAIAPDVDAFVCSGGVSMGERDPVKAAFAGDASRGSVAFANVGMQPGRPQAFGAYRGKPLWGLPGNPISVYVSFAVFVRPALAVMMGRTDEPASVDAVLTDPLDAPRTRTRYARVRLERDGDRLLARPEGGHQSNLLATFARADGLVAVEAGTTIGAGEPCRVLLIRDP